MRKERASRFPILVAVDDSSVASTVIRAALQFPWPRNSSAHGVVATGLPWMPEHPGHVHPALSEGLRRAASAAERKLRHRWPEATVDVIDRPPLPAILSAADAVGARTIVVGWRGHGLVYRLFSGGSVARGVVRAARHAVLVVKGRARDVRRIVVGVDGSRHARAAVRVVARLEPSRAGSVTLVSVVEPRRVPSLALLPASARAMIVRGARAEHDSRVAAAQHELDRLAALVTRTGWKVDTVVRFGPPVVELLVAARDADAIVVGARGAGGLEGLLLGSVADGVLRHAPQSVLVVR